MIWIRIKCTDESTLNKDSSVHLIYHDPSDLDHWSWSRSSQRNAPMDSYCYFCTGVKVTCCTMRNTCLLSAPNSKSYLQLKQPLPRIFRYVELWFWMVHFCGWQRRRATRKWVFSRCLTLAGFYCSKVESLLSSNCASGLPVRPTGLRGYFLKRRWCFARPFFLVPTTSKNLPRRLL